MSDLYHLAYLSQSTLGDNQVFIRNEVEQILAAAKRNNPPRNVTGALLYSGGYFCQLLEGAPAEVKPNIEPLPSMASSRDVASGTLSQSVRRVLDGGGVPTTQAGGAVRRGQPVKNKSAPAALTNAGRCLRSRRQAWGK